MLYVRTVKTASGASAVQVIRYRERKRIVVRHIGSAHTPEELLLLQQTASIWIERETKQLRLFPSVKKGTSTLLPKDKLRNLGFRYTFAYETITKLFHVFRYSQINNRLLLDLVLMRIIQPASKVESLNLLSELFGIKHNRADFYRNLGAVTACKQAIEEKTIEFAKKHFAFDFSLVFYDVTTLYFESFTEDEDLLDNEGNVTKKGLKRNGFSKDHKHNQPQIVIGLIVNRDGFPLTYEIFEGHTFEGDTFIPVIWEFKQKYKAEILTVVADAAMISFENVEKLKEKELSYIVGARIANLAKTQMATIRKDLIADAQGELELKNRDCASVRIETDRGTLVCDFSFRRYLKDKRDLEKQIIRAENLVAQNADVRRTKFLMLKRGKKKEKAYALNTELIEKTKLLLGIKGYYTNLFDKDQKITNQDIIDQYHKLWQVEKAFRIAKSDLQMRPIYHFKKQAVEAHMLICFMALAVVKYMELKTEKSTKKIIKLFKKITDARLLNALTNEEIIIRSEISTETQKLLKKLSL